MAENLATLPPAVTWKVENVPNELGGRAKISRLSPLPALLWQELGFFLWFIVNVRGEREITDGAIKHEGAESRWLLKFLSLSRGK